MRSNGSSWFYFKNMGNLKELNLKGNKIVLIESNGFQDLISVKWLLLNDNMIETLDKKLFATMVRLEFLYLNGNKNKFLSPTTFKIPGVELVYVDLESNVCIDKTYVWGNFDRLEGELHAVNNIFKIFENFN